MDYSALFIDPTSQRVGVGTFIPQKQFHIQGDMMLTGSIYDSTGEPFSLAGGAQWRSPSSTPTLIGPSGVTFAVTSNVALQRYSANDLTWNIQTTFEVSQNTANAATADYTLRLPVAMNAGAYAYASSVGELWLTATNGTITSSYKAIAKTIVGNKDTIVLRYLTGTTDASLVNIGTGFTVTLGGHIMYSTEVFVRNPPMDSIFIPTTSVQWMSTTYPHPALVGPSGSSVTITSNVGALRYIGDDLINNIYVQATLGAQPTSVSSPYTISLQYPLMTSFYSGAAIVGDLWLTVINSSVSTMYKGLARVYDTSNVAISYLNGTYELGLGTIDTGSTIHLQGNITYKTSTLATIAIPAEYVPNNFTQDISGNVAINNGGVPTRAQLDIIHYSNLPALVVDQRGSHENIVELRKNAALKLKIDGNGNITTSGTISTSNLNVLGDRVIMNTITSNTEQMVIENAGTGPALKVTQTGANSIAEFYDDGNVLALKIADGGNVGIGTSNPSAKLDVIGNIHLTGSIYKNGEVFNSSVGDSIPIGTIMPFYSTTVSDPSYLICNGGTYNRVDYIELANVLGVSPTATTFQVPDLRDKFLKGKNADIVGATGGSATRTLIEANMPAHSHSGTTTAGEGTHTHTITDPGHYHQQSSQTNPVNSGGSWYGSAVTGNGAVVNTANATTGISINSTNSAHTHTFTTDTKGSGTAFDILPPFTTVIYIIKAKNNQYITPIRDGDYWTNVSNKLIYQSGNVGIGTNNPQQLLDVNGNTLISGTVGIGGNVGIGTTIPMAKLQVNNETTRDDYMYPAAFNTGSTNTWTVAGILYGNGVHVASASSALAGTLHAYIAFNGTSVNSSDCWHSATGLYNSTTGSYTGSQTTNGYGGEWIQLQLSEAITVKSFSMYSRNENNSQGWPQVIRLYASTTGTTWTQLYENTNVNFLTRVDIKAFGIANTSSYSYYRLVINAVKGGGGYTWVTIGQLRYYGLLSNPNVSHVIVNNQNITMPYTNVGIGLTNPLTKLHVNGYITSIVPAFMASFTSGSGNQPELNRRSFTTGEKVPFNLAVFNVGNCYNTSEARFVAPISGIYQFNLAFYLTSGQLQLTFYKNGDILNFNGYDAHTYAGNNPTAYMATGSTLINLNVNEFVEIYIRSSSSGIAYLGHSHWSGYLVTPT